MNIYVSCVLQGVNKSICYVHTFSRVQDTHVCTGTTTQINYAFSHARRSKTTMKDRKEMKTGKTI